MDQPMLLTFDIDWAADFMIDAIADELIEREVRATWLVTHASPAIDRLRERPDLFELGIHPNFLEGSSHGSTVAEVLDTCMALVPEATTMRSHALLQSSLILSHVIEFTQIRCDSSIMLPGAPNLAPVGFPHAEGPLVRVPYFWEDDIEMVRPTPRWRLGENGDAPGLRVYDFHPALVFLNATDTGPYRTLKALGPLATVSEERAADFVHGGEGPRTLFLEIAERPAEGGSRTLRDVAAAHRRGVT
ncbi:MAG: hypothetical protein QOG42_288 [Solirubrobacteraceae bacterium]|nr:hypothetical protein [Solirubrobacteraceae bacterium]